METDPTLLQLILLAIISLVVGLLGGFVGLALGTMRLPALLLMGFATPVSAGTNILVSTLAAGTGSVRHVKSRRIDRRLVITMGLPAAAGSFLGGFFSNVAPESALIFLTGVFVSWQGIELTLRARPAGRSGEKENERGLLGIDLSGHRSVSEAGIGFGVGLVGGAVGLILGSIRLPAMMRLLGTDPRVAAGSNLVVGFLLGAMGFVGHGARGEVDLSILVSMAPTAMIGTYIGARFTGSVQLNTLVLVMGLTLLVVGPLLLLNAMDVL